MDLRDNPGLGGVPAVVGQLKGAVEVLMEVEKGWTMVERLLVERGDMDYLIRYAKKKMNGEVFFSFLFLYFIYLFFAYPSIVG